MRSQVHHLVSEAAWRYPDRPALSSKGGAVSYAQLWQGMRGFAGALAGLGLGRGDRVGVYLDKRAETVTALFGTSAGGGVFVPINPVLRPRQVGHIVRDCEVRVLVTSPERLASLHAELQECKSVEHVVLVGGDPSAVPELVGRYALHPWPSVPPPATGAATSAATGAATSAATGGLAAIPVGGDVDTDMAAILYTSGSTGRPKGVVLSHRNLIVGAESVSLYLGNTVEDVILSVLPLSFDAGLSQLTTAFSVGAQVVLLNYLLPADVVRMCARYGVTGLTCVPPLWIQIADQDWPPDVAQRMRYIANTGGRMPRATLHRLRSIFPAAEPFLMYGLTEAFRSTYLDPVEVDRRPESIGKAIPNAEILVVRPDGSVCDAGEEGELVHRGPLVALGYWNDPVRTAERFRPAPSRDPGLCTQELAVWSGDAVVRDEEGFLYFVGRKDEMIKTSGYRVSPTEIEEVAYDTGLVRDAVALGAEDSALGQHIVLVVSPPAGGGVDVDGVLAELRGSLPLYMVPKRAVVRSEIPRSPNGKFDRALLRQELMA